MYKNINRIPSHYVSETCAQIMIPYSSTITLLNKEGIVFNIRRLKRQDSQRKEITDHSNTHTNILLHLLSNYIRF